MIARSTLNKYLKSYKNPVALYFLIAGLVSTATPIMSIGLGKSGFALIPYMSALFALAVFSYCTLYLASWVLKGYPIIVYKEGSALLLTAIVVIVSGLVMGVVGQNDKSYIVSDLIYALNFAGLILVACAVNWRKHEADFDTWAPPLIVMFLLIALMGSSAKSQLFLLSIVGAVIYAVVFRKGVMALFFLSPILLNLSAMNRAGILAFFVALLIAAIVARRGLLFLSVISASFMVYLVIVNGVALNYIPQGTQLYRRVLEINNLVSGAVEIREIVSLQQRIFEINLVEDYFAQSGLRGMFGAGFGATLDFSAAPDASTTWAALLGGQDVHNIHSLPHALAYRNGIAGLGVLIFVIVKSFLNVYEIWRLKIRTVSTLFFAIYPIASVIYAMTASNYFVTDFIVGAMVILGSHSIRLEARNSKRPLLQGHALATS